MVCEKGTSRASTVGLRDNSYHMSIIIVVLHIVWVLVWGASRSRLVWVFLSIAHFAFATLRHARCGVGVWQVLCGFMAPAVYKNRRCDNDFSKV